MFWDKVSGLYDVFETIYNGKVYRGLGERVAKEIDKTDIVLECACGTGAISQYIAPKCKCLIATDFSEGMLRQTWKKCRKYQNVKIKRADMTQLKFRDNRFDKVIAGNVIHLLEVAGADFKRQFDFNSYKKFFVDAGYQNVDCSIISSSHFEKLLTFH